MEDGERIRKSFGSRLRKFRESTGMTAETLGERLRVHPNSVYRLERGEVWVGSDVLERVGVALNIDIARLFTDAELHAPTPQEALAVIARELETRRETPARDQLARKLAKLEPSARAVIEAMVDSALVAQESPKQHGKAPEKGK